MGFDVVGVGDLCLDFTAATDVIPKTDMVSPLFFTASQGGGKVPTALVTLSRLGVSTALFATVGDDPAGRFCRQELADAGVNTNHMVVLPGEKTNLSICLAEQSTGGRSFLGKYDLRGILPEELDHDVIAGSKFIHLWRVTPATIAAAELVRRSGGQVVYDADRYNRETEDYIDMTDVFICSEFFFRGMFGDDVSGSALRRGLEEVRSRGPRIAVVTLGSRGYAGVDSDGYFQGPAYHNIRVVDSTGAGDVFHGAFIYGLLQAWDARRCAAFASAVSAIKCTVPGGRAGIPDAETTRRFMETGQIDTDVLDKWQAYYAAHRIL